MLLGGGSGFGFVGAAVTTVHCFSAILHSPSPAPNCLPCRLRCFFIQPQNGMFDGAVYQGYSDGQRFDFFCRVSHCRLCRCSGSGLRAASLYLLYRCAAERLYALSCLVTNTSVDPHPPAALQAALEFLLRTGRQPDILHCHDWSTADIAKAYWTEYHHYGLWKPKVVSSAAADASPDMVAQ